MTTVDLYLVLHCTLQDNEGHYLGPLAIKTSLLHMFGEALY